MHRGLCSGEVCSSASDVPQCAPPPCIITPRPKARVKYAPVKGGGVLHAGWASCRRGVLYAICRLQSCRGAGSRSRAASSITEVPKREANCARIAGAISLPTVVFICIWRTPSVQTGHCADYEGLSSQPKASQKFPVPQDETTEQQTRAHKWLPHGGMVEHSRPGLPATAPQGLSSPTLSVAFTLIPAAQPSAGGRARREPCHDA